MVPGLFGLIFFSHKADAQTAFVDVTKSAGIDHQFQVFEGTFGGGAAIFDLNNDGWEDIFITGGMKDDVLYLNKGDGTFENIYDRSGLRTGIKYITQGAVSADVNRDGWRDLFVTTITTKDSLDQIPRAANLLYINNGDGTFRDATHEYGLDEYLTFSTGAMFGDVNLDGYPDLYVGNYFQRFEGKLHIMNDAIIVGSQQMAEGLLLINKKGKYFEDQYKAYGLSHKGFGFGGAFSDFDNDYDLDLIINHDFGYKSIPNKLLENQYPEDQYLEISDTMNMALPINGMGIAVGDYNNDGLMDYYITNIRANPFMVNQGRGKPFVNMNSKLGIMINMIRTKEGAYLPISWGANFADFDHDTDLDLFVANGCLNPFVLPNANYYFENAGNEFINKSNEKGLADNGVSRGSVVFDYDNDGDQDLLVVNQAPVSDGLPNASPTLLFRNDSTKGNWIKIELIGNEADKNGIGSRIEVVVSNVKMIREVDGGSSHMSQNSTIAHFGLGSASIVDSINVIWLAGKMQSLIHQKSNQKITIHEAQSVKSYYGAYWYIPPGLLIILVIFYSFKKWNTKSRCAFFLMIGLLYGCNTKKNDSPVKIILDTDIAGDYDDVGAMAVLHNLADNNEAEILAVMSCNAFPTTVPTISVLNEYFGRPEIPIGVTKAEWPNKDCPQKWAEAIIARYPHSVKSNNAAPDAVELYRKILASQPDTSVTIVTVGFFTNLANLLDSQSDSYSQLAGRDLVKKKVKELVSMAAGIAKGKESAREYNVFIDTPASKKVFDEWPTTVTLSGFEIGEQILTGIKLINNSSIRNSPVKDAYQIALGKDNNTKGRMSWDQTAVLAGIKGLEPFFTYKELNFEIKEDGTNVIIPGKKFKYILFKQTPEQIGEYIEGLMMGPPGSK